MQIPFKSRRTQSTRINLTSLFERLLGRVGCAVAMVCLTACGGAGHHFNGEDGAGEACQPSWECEQPLNGNEADGCRNRRPNPACDAPSPCGNGVRDPGEACDSNGDIGCSGATPVCQPDCSECTGADGDLVFSGDFENGDWTPPWKTSCKGDDDFDDFSIVTAPVRQGKYSARFRLNGNSVCGGTWGNRFELYETGNEREGSEYWYSLSAYFDPSWGGGDYYHIFLQWHGPTVLSPELSLQTHGSSIRYTMCTGVSPERPTPTENCAYRTYPEIIPNFEKGVWYDFLVHVKWTASAKGFVEIFAKTSTESVFDELVNLRDVPTLQHISGIADQVSSTHIGLYRSGGYTDTDIIYLDNFRMGTTRSSVE